MYQQSSAVVRFSLANLGEKFKLASAGNLLEDIMYGCYKSEYMLGAYR